MDLRKIWRKTYRTMAQTLAGVLGGTALFWEIDWKVVISTTVMSGLLCFLMGIADSDNTAIEDDEYESADVVELDDDEWDDPAEDEEL